jgi:hypothetical protein
MKIIGPQYPGNNMTRLFLFTALILITTTLAAGKMYRWVDENGVTQYTQSPPPKGDATEVKPPPPPAVSPEEAQRKLNAQRQQLEDLREDRSLAKQKTKEGKEEKELNTKNCQLARNNLKRLQENPRGRWMQKDGQQTRYSDEERQTKIKEAQDQIQEFCK